MTERRRGIHLPTRRPRSAPGEVRPAAEIVPEHEMEPDLHVDAVDAPVEQSVVDAAIYQGGKRTESPSTVAQTAHRLREEAGKQAAAATGGEGWWRTRDHGLDRSVSAQRQPASPGGR